MNPASPTPVSTSDSLDVGATLLVSLERAGGAAFLSEVRNSLLTTPAFTEAGMDSALELLENQGSVLVRDHFWPDPHLEGEDLRIVGLLRAPDGIDRVAHCIDMIEASWSEWLATYLADHRCS